MGHTNTRARTRRLGSSREGARDNLSRSIGSGSCLGPCRLRRKLYGYVRGLDVCALTLNASHADTLLRWETRVCCMDQHGQGVPGQRGITGVYYLRCKKNKFLDYWSTEGVVSRTSLHTVSAPVGTINPRSDAGCGWSSGTRPGAVSEWHAPWAPGGVPAGGDS